MVKQYKEGITLITPTGDTPLAIERCEYYMSRQTLMWDQWVISDDGQNLSKYTLSTLNQEVYYRPFSSNKAKSFTGNILNCLSHVEYNKILVIESDDWYHPEYIETTIQRLSNCDLTGSPNSIYYNIVTKSWRQNNNQDRASFCETAFRSNIISIVEKHCQLRQSAFVDSRVWREKGINKKLFSDRRLCVGIKGMPGRSGIGVGHRPGPTYRYDKGWIKLRELIGKDANFYIDLFKKGIIG